MLDVNCECFSINNVHGINTAILRRTQSFIDLLLRISSAVPESNISSRNSTTKVKLHPLEQFVQWIEQEMHEQRSSKKEINENDAVHNDVMSDRVIEPSAVVYNNNDNIHSALSRVIADSQGSWIYRHHVQQMHNFLDTVSRELSRAIEETFLQSILQRNKHNVNVKESICDYDIHVQLLPSSVMQEVDKPSSLSALSSSLSSSSSSPLPITTALLSQSNSQQSQKSRELRMRNEDSNNSVNAFCACVVIRRRDVLERRRRGQEELYRRYMNVAAPGQTLHDALEFWKSVSYSNDYLQCLANKTKQSSSSSSSHAGLRSFDTHDKRTFDSSNNIDESYGSKDKEHATECEEANAFIKPHSFTSQTLSSSSLSSEELMQFPLSTREVEQLRPIDFDDCNNSWYETDAMLALTENSGNSHDIEIDYSNDDNDNSYHLFQERINRSNSRVNNNIKNEQVNKIYRNERDIYRNRDRDKRARVIFGSQEKRVNLTTGEEIYMQWQQPMQLLTTKINTIPKNAQVASNQKRARRTQYSHTTASKDWNKYIAHSECGLVAVLYVSLQSIVYVAYLNREYINEHNNNNNNSNSKTEVINDATIAKTAIVELQNTHKSKRVKIDEHPANTHILTNKDSMVDVWMLPLESDTSFTRGLLKMS